MGFAKKQEAAAKRNFDLVNASYTLGVASILDLLDAQEQLLDAELSLVDAVYGFLSDLFAAERTLTFYPFLEPPEETQALLADLERAIGTDP